MKNIIISILLINICFSCAYSQSKKKSTANVFSKLSRNHPRLIINKKLINELNSKFGKSELFTEIVLENYAKADQYTKGKPPVYTFADNKFNTNPITIGNRLLTLTIAYLLSKKKIYFDRAVLEMKAIEKLSSWNINRPTDYTKIAIAFILSYDWLYNSFEKGDLRIFRTAINKKCIEEGRKFYKEKSQSLLKHTGFFSATPHNALLLASLTIGKPNKIFAIEVYKNALKFLKMSQREYGDDGSFYAGQFLWSSQTFRLVLASASMKTALGDSTALTNHKGFMNTPDFIIHNHSNIHLPFNYADNVNDNNSRTYWLLYWFSKIQKRNEYTILGNNLFNLYTSTLKRHRGTSWPISILFFNEKDSQTKINLPLDKVFKSKTQVAIFRSEWENPDAIWLGMKAGKIKLGYAHMDIGSFELDADGERWALDLGKEYKPVAQYKYSDRRPNGARWKYYRTSSLSHNTLTFKNQLQNIEGEGKFTTFVSTPKNAYATIDMNSVYKGQANKVIRGFALLDRKRVLIQDEIGTPLSEVRWAFITPAQVELSGNKAMLFKNGKTMHVEILSPKNIKFKTISTDVYLDPKQRKNTGTTMLAFTVPKANYIVIKVLFTPGSKIEEKFPEVFSQPLNSWPKENTKKK